jgi:PAS domain S-box-containing protein
MDKTTVRSVALLVSNREKGEKIAHSLSRRKVNVAILDKMTATASASVECVVAEAALLASDYARSLLDASVALIVLGAPERHQGSSVTGTGSAQDFPLLRILPARVSWAALYVAVLQLCAARDAIVASRTAVDAVQNQLRTLLSSVPDIVYTLDEHGNFIYLNESAALLGYEVSELIGRHFSIIIHPEDKPNISRDIVVEKIRQANKFPDIPPKLFDERRSGQRMTRDLEVRLVHKDGHVIYALVNAYGERHLDMPLLSDVVGQNPQTIGVVHDVSAMHFYQQSLEDSLAAKERLLREIHHRVKTNLQLVASLAHLKQDDTSAASAGVLRELEAQIKSIALVHEALYQSEQVDQVSARDFFARFCRAAEESLEVVGSTVHVRFSADDCPLDPDRLVPLSLALLELLGGAYQTAFETRTEALVSLAFKCTDDGRRVLEVQGEGIMKKSDSQIMHALLKQAGASLEVLEEGDSRAHCRLIVERRP